MFRKQTINLALLMQVTVINFTLSPSGLEDQMLGLVVAKKRPDLEEAKNALIVSNAQMKAELEAIEDKILKLLEECRGSPVDNEELIQTLVASKLKSGEIQVVLFNSLYSCMFSFFLYSIIPSGSS